MGPRTGQAGGGRERTERAKASCETTRLQDSSKRQELCALRALPPETAASEADGKGRASWAAHAVHGLRSEGDPALPWEWDLSRDKPCRSTGAVGGHRLHAFPAVECMGSQPSQAAKPPADCPLAKREAGPPDVRVALIGQRPCYRTRIRMSPAIAKGGKSQAPPSLATAHELRQASQAICPCSDIRTHIAELPRDASLFPGTPSVRSNQANAVRSRSTGVVDGTLLL